MLSLRLLRKVEDNWRAIAESIVQQARCENSIPKYQSLSDSELFERARDLLQQLGRWLTTEDRAQLVRRYEELGRQRCREGVPLPEVVYKMLLIRRTLADYIRDQSETDHILEIYGELEMLRALDAFFDQVLRGVVDGYWREQEVADRRGTSHQVAAPLKGLACL